jgi:hypothetical protein
VDKNNPLGISSDQVFRSLTSDNFNKDLDVAAAKLRSDKKTYTDAYKASVNDSAANEVTRAKGQEFADAAVTAIGKSTEITAALPDLEQQAQVKNADEKAVSEAQIRNQGGSGRNTNVSERERIGLGASYSYASSAVAVAEKSRVELVKHTAEMKTQTGLLGELLKAFPDMHY